MAFLKGLLKTFKRPFEGVEKAFQKPLKAF
jgi:hypothetical protein